MAEKMSLERRWKNFKPTKGLLAWAAIAGSALTMVVGFAWGGWLLQSSAEYAQTTAVNESRTQLLASFCVDRFTGAENAAAKLADLKKAGEWERRDMIRNGGWIAINNVTAPTDGAAANMCVERLMAAETMVKAAK